MTLIQIITPFPQMATALIGESILARATAKGLVEYRLHDLFQYADPPHYRIDDYPFGGGSGMVMKPEPLFRATEQAISNGPDNSSTRVVYPTPDAPLFSQSKARELAHAEHLVFLSGHYKGVDQRVRDLLVTDELSIGDYVLTGGELPTMVILDAVVRLIPGVLNSIESAETDSHTSDLLDWPHYTRPVQFQDLKVPDVLLSGHHGKIAEWRRKQEELKTRSIRPDLWQKYKESK